MALTKIPVSLSATPSISDSGTSTAITIDSNGHVTLAGNLSVTGSTTTADNLVSADKNITLNYHASNDTSGSADGAGITIQDAVDASNDATLTWDASNDRFSFSHPVNISHGTPVLRLHDSSSSATTTITLDGVNTTIDSNGTDGDIIFKGQDSSSEITALTLDMSEAGNATFNGTIGASAGTVSLPSLYMGGDTNTGLYSVAADNIGFAIGGVAKGFWSATQLNVTGIIDGDNFKINGAQGSDGQVMTSTGSGVAWETPSAFNADAAQIFNDSGAAVDFRIESDDNANMFFVDGSEDKIGIGYGSPASPLDVRTTHTSTDVTAANTNSTLTIGNIGSGDGVYNSIKFAGNQQDMYMMSVNHATQASRRIGFFVGSVAGDATTDERLSILGNGRVGIGDTGPGHMLTVKDTTASDAHGIADFIGSDSGQRLLVANYLCGSDEDRVGLYWENQGVINMRMWMGDDGKLYSKSGNPGNDTDGNQFVQLDTSGRFNEFHLWNGTAVDKFKVENYNRGVIFNSIGSNGMYSEYQLQGTAKFRMGQANHLISGESAANWAFQAAAGEMIWGAGTTETMRLNSTGLSVKGGTLAHLGLSGSGGLLSLGGDDSQIRMANQVIHADNTGYTTFYLRNNYGQTNASASMRLQSGFIQMDTGTSYTKRYTIHGNGKHEFWGAHQGDSVGHFVFSNGVGTDGTSTNCTLMVKNGNAQVQIMPWSTLGARVGTRGGGWNSNSNNACYLTSNDASNIILNTNGSPTLGNGTAISSDERLKKDITDISGGQLAKINALKPRNFKWKDPKKTGNQEGFIAQEVESVIPEAVEERIFSPDPDDESRDFEGDIKVLKHEVINARLIKAVQELSDKLEAAEARITTLEG